MSHRFGTRAIHAGQEPDASTGAIMTPIYATSTYVQESPGKHKGFEYSRSHNPTRFAYERCVADLEGGTRGFAFASGVAATATALDLLDSGDHVVAGNDLFVREPIHNRCVLRHAPQQTLAKPRCELLLKTVFLSHDFPCSFRIASTFAAGVAISWVSKPPKSWEKASRWVFAPYEAVSLLSKVSTVAFSVARLPGR